MSHPTLDPIGHLDALSQRLERTHRFEARTPKEVRWWQKRTHRMLLRRLAIDQMAPVPLRPTILEEVDRGSYLQRKVLIHSGVDLQLPVYLLIPHGLKGKAACVLALNGHGYGVQSILGITEDGLYRDQPGGYQQDFAVQLARRGFVVAAPEISCFGERETHYGHLPEHSPRPSACHNASTYALMLGLTMPGLRVWDGLRVVDYLETLDFADVGRLGVMGISGGGMHAFFSACVDRRIRAAVISGYFCDWRKSILSINHCTCNFVPGLLKMGELSDLAGLIAPRPLLIENGTHDPLFPVEDVRQSVTHARRAWSVLGVGDRVREDYFDDGHRINGVVAYPFFEEQLVGPRTLQKRRKRGRYDADLCASP